MKPRPTWVSFGGTAAIVTSTSLILGMDAATGSRQAIVSALLVFAVADNLTDALSVHAYQEAERLAERESFVSTLSNFGVRLLIAMTFVGIVLGSPATWVPLIAAGWGLLLLALLTAWLARSRQAPVTREVAKHLAVAIGVIGLSRWLGILLGGLR